MYYSVLIFGILKRIIAHLCLYQSNWISPTFLGSADFAELYVCMSHINVSRFFFCLVCCLFFNETPSKYTNDMIDAFIIDLQFSYFK